MTKKGGIGSHDPLDNMRNDRLFFPVKCKTNGCYKMTTSQLKLCRICQKKSKK